MKYLRNRKTGVVFPYHRLLAKNKNMEPCDKAGTSHFEEVDATGSTVVDSGQGGGDTNPPAPTGGDSGETNNQPPPAAVTDNGIVISRANKGDLIAFALKHYGVQLEDNQTVPELREQVKKLIEKDEE